MRHSLYVARTSARPLTMFVASTVALLVAGSASAADAAAPSGAPPVAAPVNDAPAPAAAPASTSDAKSGVLLGAKVGGLLPFSGLGPNVTGGLEVGYAFGSIALAIDADYAAPKSHDVASDPRVTSASYSWHLTEQELEIMPVFLYRFTKLGSIIPFAGVGPRIYLLRSTVRSNDATPTISETTEQSTKIGVGVPLGVEIKAGPGSFLGEVLLQYGALDHTATGTSNTGGASLSLGYRIIL